MDINCWYHVLYFRILVRSLTVWHTFILDLKILVCPGTRIWKDVRASDDNTLRPIVTPETFNELN